MCLIVVLCGSIYLMSVYEFGAQVGLGPNQAHLISGDGRTRAPDPVQETADFDFTKASLKALGSFGQGLATLTDRPCALCGLHRAGGSPGAFTYRRYRYLWEAC